MGEAMLIRKGGAVYRSLEIASPPDKTRYVASESVDVTGTVVNARFGSVMIPLHESAWSYTPARPLTEADTEIVISATLGRITKTASVPITVESFSAVLDENPWNVIAAAAANGLAKQLWNVGDIKYDYYDGYYIGYRIIGFDHDDLDPTDERYSDTNYNGNTKKAGITFQAVTAFGRKSMNLTATQVGGWKASNMRTTTMPNDLTLIHEDQAAVIRTVTKYANAGDYGEAAERVVVASADKLFLLGGAEMIENTTSVISSYERNYCKCYDWYKNGNPRAKSDENEWLRSPHAPRSCSNKSHFVAVSVAGNLTSVDANVAQNYYPAFCV